MAGRAEEDIIGAHYISGAVVAIIEFPKTSATAKRDWRVQGI
jgi:hypothetical protein